MFTISEIREFAQNTKKTDELYKETKNYLIKIIGEKQKQILKLNPDIEKIDITVTIDDKCKVKLTTSVKLNIVLLLLKNLVKNTDLMLHLKNIRCTGVLQRM